VLSPQRGGMVQIELRLPYAGDAKARQFFDDL
jgi:hypothetical protein